MYHQREIRRQLQWQKNNESTTWNIKSKPLNEQKNLAVQKKAAAELGIPKNTMYAWTKAAREGRLNVGSGSHTPETAMNLAEELALLRRQVREQEKEIRRLKEENEFPEEASAFFAAGRRKSAKGRE